MGKARPAKPRPVLSPAPADAPDPLKVNLYEAGALKGALDEVAREVILDAGYEENIMISNIKLGLGLTAVGIALFAQFGAGKFPDSWWTVLCCVVVYIVLTLCMNWYSWTVEGDSFLVTRPFKGRSGLRLSSRLSRFAEQYSLILTDIDDYAVEVEGTVEVPNFFHADGFLAETAWRAEVDKLFADFSAKCAAAAPSTTATSKRGLKPKRE